MDDISTPKPTGLLKVKSIRDPRLGTITLFPPEHGLNLVWAIIEEFGSFVAQILPRKI